MIAQSDFRTSGNLEHTQRGAKLKPRKAPSPINAFKDAGCISRKQSEQAITERRVRRARISTDMRRAPLTFPVRDTDPLA